MTISEALQLLIAAVLPLMVFILTGLRKSVNDIKNAIQPVITDTAVLKSEMKTVQRQLKIMEE